ncbi:MAPEG family protein [Maricaulis sp.]|uniref:MAPEG family protein n=1 Tax=Maricaulis sp. TaxID=1486257 RepID=UPI002631EC77|nr:MAPEG family protein [Maricaulis sp.]
MTVLEIAGLYVGLQLILTVALAFNVSLNRQRSAVSLGIGEDQKLEQATRVHANQIEHGVPGMAGLIALALVDTSATILHGLGIALLVARLLHAQGLMSVPGRSFGRLVGTLVSWLTLVAMGVLLIVAAL